MLEQLLTGQSTFIALARFAIIVSGGSIFTRAIVMPITRKIASRKVEKVTTQTSIENITGLLFGVSFLSLGL